MSTESNITSVCIVHADCIDYLGDPPLEEDLYDVAVTSPPYNIGKKDAGEFEVSMPDGEYLDWLVARMACVWRALKPDGSLFLNIAGKPSKQQLPYMLVVKMLESGWVLQNTFHWVKSISLEVDGEMRSQGHFKPINSNRFVNDMIEPVFHFTKTGRVAIDRLAVGVPYQDKSNVGRWETAGGDRRCRGNVWFIPYETRNARAAHCTAFPVELPRMCIAIHGVSNPRVLDPFMGSGTTGMAAVSTGASRFLGIDRSAAAVGIAHDRLMKCAHPVIVHTVTAGEVVGPDHTPDAGVVDARQTD